MTVESKEMIKIGGYGGLISIMFQWHAANNTHEFDHRRAVYFDSITIPDLVTCIAIINKMISNVPENKMMDAWNEIWNLLKGKKCGPSTMGLRYGKKEIPGSIDAHACVEISIIQCGVSTRIYCPSCEMIQPEILANELKETFLKMRAYAIEFQKQQDAIDAADADDDELVE
jgi:hypothetical protein